MTKNKNKKKVFRLQDMSLAGQITSHIKNFRSTQAASDILYNGNAEKPRFEGSISKEGKFTLSHYGTPILSVEKKEAKILDLPKVRHGNYSNGDLTAINTAFSVLGLKRRVIKRQGTLYTLKFEPVEL